MFIDNPIHFCWLMMLDEKMGLGEAYMAGDWRAEPNPTEFLKLLIRAKSRTTSFLFSQEQILLFTHSTEETSVNKRPAKKANGKFAAVAMAFALDVLRRAVAIYTYIQHRIRDNTMKQSAKNIEGMIGVVSRGGSVSSRPFMSSFQNTTTSVTRCSSCSWTRR